MRVILYTGKGGVGKTSIAAVSACRMAMDGKRVLVMSTDAAHSLGDSFDIRLSREPQTVVSYQDQGSVDAMEIDTVYESEQTWKNMQDYMKRMLTSRGEGGIEAEELLVFPGMEELFSLFKILDFYHSDTYDALVVDCAPTGETLSLLKYPEMLSDFMEKVLPIKRKGVKVAGPAVEKLTRIPMPDDSFFDDLERVMDKMEELQKLLLDKETVSLRIVTTPEKIVIKEAKRNFTCLHLYNYNVDAIMVNRIYPEKAMEGYFSKWIEMQREGLMEIQESFSEVPKFYLELQDRELRTIPVLEKIAGSLYEDTDPVNVLFHHDIFSLSEDGATSILKIYLPFAEKDELDLRQNDTELLIGVKNERRSYPLAKHLQEKEIVGAAFEDGYLNVRFQ
ncbi:MAG: ArsA family ATPase [bacterium]|nr:ArsA family ATPase [bacterium]